MRQRSRPKVLMVLGRRMRGVYALPCYVPKFTMRILIISVYRNEAIKIGWHIAQLSCAPLEMCGNQTPIDFNDSARVRLIQRCVWIGGAEAIRTKIAPRFHQMKNGRCHVNRVK